MLRIENFIGGRFTSQADAYLPNYEPATGKIYSEFPESSTADLDAAIEAARHAYPRWSALSAEKRAHYLFRIADAIDEHREELAQAESQDCGKPIQFARTVDIPRAAANMRFFAHAITQFASEAHPGTDAIHYTLRDPIGTFVCISPWNLPLYLLTWKLAPALATGNCAIAKPSELTPMTAFRFAKLCADVGLPEGVLSVLHGTGPKIGAALCAHQGIKGVTFTGGTKTGAHIASVVAPQFKKMSLELGGKNANLIFANCDFEAAVAHAVKAGFSNQGQICLCGSRILVEQSIYHKFKDAFVARVRALRPTDPQNSESEMGALISKSHLDKVMGYIALAKSEGGRVLCGGETVSVAGRCAEGYFMQPTILEGLDQSCRVIQEEIFGPVVTLQPFTDEDDAIKMANGVPYGLAATVWSNDIKQCHRMAKRLETGIVWVNTWMLRDLRTPFGGIKQSGVGREGGLEALRFFTEPKNVCIAY